MKKQTKKWMKTAAAAMFGAAVCCAGASLSASADASLDTETGVLTLSGNVNYNEVHSYAEDNRVKQVVCEQGTVLPEDCGGLFTYFLAESIDLSGADSSGVRSMNSMFAYDAALTSLNLTTLDTREVTDMTNMFTCCANLPKLDLTSFDTANLLSAIHMFYGCEKLEQISASELWDMNSAVSTENMFLGCTALTGGRGTVYDSTVTDKTLARIDTADHAGYFTAPFTGVSVSLAYDLALKFYVSMTDAGSWDNVKVIFTGKCAEAGEEIRFYVKPEGSFARANLSADHMDEPIKADLYRKISGEWFHMDTVTYSVNDYLNNAQPEADWSSAKKDAFVKLLGTVKTYGEVTKAYFGNGDMSGINVPVHTIGELADKQEETHKTFEPNFTSSQATISLVLDSRMMLRLYIENLQIGDKTSNGKSATAGKDGRACFEVTTYAPLNLDGPPVLKYHDVSYMCSPLSWCWRALEADGGDPKNTAMACVIYEYWLDSQAFEYAPNN